MFSILSALVSFMMAVSDGESQDSIDKYFERFKKLLKEQDESQKIHEQNIEKSNKLHNKSVEMSNRLHQKKIDEINNLEKMINDDSINSSISKNDLKDFINEIEAKIDEMPGYLISETDKNKLFDKFEEIRLKLNDSPKM